MTNQILSVCIIGLGSVGKAQLQAFEELENIDIVAVCDVQIGLAKDIARKYDARWFEDYRTLIDQCDLDLALVLTPASTHREIVEAVANARIHVLCEKPLALTVEDGKAMVAACRKAGVKLFYGSCYRYLPAVRKAHELIRSGVIGKIQLMSEQLIGGSGLMGYEELSPSHYPLGGPGGAGAGLVDHGIHLIDIFSWFAGSKIIDVQGQGQLSNEHPASEVMTMRFECGALGHLLYNTATYSTDLPNEGMFSLGSGWLADGTIATPGLWEAHPGSISVYGTKGALRIFHYANALFINNNGGLKQIELSGRPAFGHFATQLEQCAASIWGDTEPLVTGEDGVRALSALLAVYE